MELTVTFECPACGCNSQVRVADLAPGVDRRCVACDLPTMLTDSGIRDLRFQLREIFPPLSSPTYSAEP